MNNLYNASITPESIAAARAAVNAKPQGAQLVSAGAGIICGRHAGTITPGDLAWRYPGGHPGGPGDPAYVGPNACAGLQEYSWVCRACGQRKGWDTAPIAPHTHTVSQDGGESYTTYKCNYLARIVELEAEVASLRAQLGNAKAR